MRLFFVTKSLTFQGGAERVLVEVTGALAERGHDVSVATFDRPALDPFYPMSRKVIVRPLGIGDIGTSTGVVALADRARALRGLVKSTLPDVAIGFLNSSYVPMAIGLIGSGIPVIASEHIVYEHYRTLTLQRLILHTIAPMTDAFTAVSDEMRESFPPRIRRKMHVIPHPIAPFRSPADVVGGTRKILLSVGRLEPQKDFATLVSAFAMLADEFPQWILRIVGEGALRQSIEAQARELGLATRIELPGSVRNIEQEYGAAQLFVLPSLYESFGLVTAEALSQGLPAVGFADCPGTNALITPGHNGLLAPGRGSPESLADSLRHLMETYATRLCDSTAYSGSASQITRLRPLRLAA